MWKGRRRVLMGVVVVGRRRSGDALERRASLVRRVIAEGWVGVRGFRMGMGNVEYVSWRFEEEEEISLRDVI